jgi:hypothetical protein
MNHVVPFHLSLSFFFLYLHFLLSGPSTEIENKSEALREVKRKSDSDSKVDEGSSKKAKV